MWRIAPRRCGSRPNASDGPEPVNIGTGEEISISSLASMVAAAVGFEGDIVWDRSKPNGQPRRRLNVERAADGFGFRARTPLAEGISRTVAWASQRMPTSDMSVAG